MAKKKQARKKPTKGRASSGRATTAKAKAVQLTDAVLPGMEDSAIASLERAARKYVETRDARMELTRDEVADKADVLDEMKKAEKTYYKHGDLEVRLVPASEESVKVKVLGKSTDDDK